MPKNILIVDGEGHELHDLRAALSGAGYVTRVVEGVDQLRWSVGVLPPDLAFVHLRQDTSLVAAAEGWDPGEWQRVAKEVGKSMAWSVPDVARAGDPPLGVAWPV